MFTLHGTFEGKPASATWQPGTLTGEPRGLLDELHVRVGEQHALAGVGAPALDLADPLSVEAALRHVLDTVTSAEGDMPEYGDLAATTEYEARRAAAEPQTLAEMAELDDRRASGRAGGRTGAVRRPMAARPTGGSAA